MIYDVLLFINARGCRHLRQRLQASATELLDLKNHQHQRQLVQC